MEIEGQKIDRNMACKNAVRAIRCSVALCVLVLSGIRGEAQTLRELRFSPDGRYVLAQDNSNITILTVQPFATLFRIAADKADVAHFTPDSRQIVFVSSGITVDPDKIVFRDSPAHVERWNIADQTRIESAEIPVLVCGTEKLSPDGTVLACLDLENALLLIDIGSGLAILKQKRFIRVQADRDRYSIGSVKIDFSTDGHFVIVRPRNADGSPIAWDLRGRSVVRLTGPLKQLKNNGSSVFIAADRLVMWGSPLSARDYERGLAKAKVIAFPTGKVVSAEEIPIGSLVRATDPGFLLIQPFFGYKFLGGHPFEPIAAVDLNTGLVIASHTPWLDVCGRVCVAEPAAGQVGLYDIEGPSGHCRAAQKVIGHEGNSADSSLDHSDLLTSAGESETPGSFDSARTAGTCSRTNNSGIANRFNLFQIPVGGLWRPVRAGFPAGRIPVLSLLGAELVDALGF